MDNAAIRRQKLSMFLLDLFYPNRCPCCNQRIAWNAYLCESCKMEIFSYATNSFCPKCGKYGNDCICHTNPSYDHAIVFTIYKNSARSGVLSMKDSKSLNFGIFCGDQLAKRILSDNELASYDFVIPVPMSSRKKRRRRCNPAAVLAKEISMITEIPLRENILLNSGVGKTQHFLSAKERSENVSQFSIHPVNLKSRRILLCDDVLTTGSTMNRCAALLKEQGAAEVTAVSATVSVLQKT